jgi:hypothetical protein
VETSVKKLLRIGYKQKNKYKIKTERWWLLYQILVCVQIIVVKEKNNVIVLKQSLTHGNHTLLLSTYVLKTIILSISMKLVINLLFKTQKKLLKKKVRKFKVCDIEKRINDYEQEEQLKIDSQNLHKYNTSSFNNQIKGQFDLQLENKLMTFFEISNLNTECMIGARLFCEFLKRFNG